MIPYRPLGVLSLLIVLTAPAPRVAGAEGDFDSLYGSQVEEVTATVTPEDDAELAAEILETAEESTDDAALLARLCEEAYRLGSKHPAGYDAAVEAMILLARQVPSQRAEHLTDAAALQQRAFRRASGASGSEQVAEGEKAIDILLALARTYQEGGQWEAAMACYRQASAIAEEAVPDRRAAAEAALTDLETAQRIEQLRSRLASNPTDGEAADELMWLLVVEKNDPEAAAEYRFSAQDREMRENIIRAARDPEDLFGDEALALGDWYRGLVEEASPNARAAMRDRSRFYYQLFLDEYRSDEESRQRVADALEALDASVEDDPVDEVAADNVIPASADGAEMRRGSSSEPGGEAVAEEPSIPAEEDGFIDLFQGVDTAEHGGRGVWESEGGGLVGTPPTPAQLTLPHIPSGDYALDVRFTRVSAIGSAALHLPVGDRHVLVKLGDRRRRQRDHIAGLSMVKDQGAENNSTTTVFELETDKRYAVHVEVTKPGAARRRIHVRVDDEPLIEWEGLPAELSVADAWGRFDSDALGLGVDGGGEIRFHSARLRMLGGEAQPLQ